MPGTKSRTKRRKKHWTHGPTPRKEPEGISTLQSPVVPSAVASAPSTSTASPSTPRATTASKKKLSVSPYVFLDASDDSSSSSSSSAEESEGELEGHGSRLFELEGLKSVLQAVRCGECKEKGLVYREDFSKRKGLHTAPYLLRQSCKSQVSIPFSSVGDAIRRNKGDVQAMMKAVQATLLHSNSTNEQPRHHLCPVGPDSWCKWQVAQATGTMCDHKEPLPDAIVQLLRPIYPRLGSRSLLEKCVHGYTQNANESLHALVWKFCPKELFLGRTGVKTAWALAVCCFNDGSSSLAATSDRLLLSPSLLSKSFLKKKDLKRVKKSEYKVSEGAKKV